MSDFKAHWTEGKPDENRVVVHTFFAAPLQIGGTIKVIPWGDDGAYHLSTYVANYNMPIKGDNPTGIISNLDAAKKHVESYWLPLIKAAAPHYLPDPK